MTGDIQEYFSEKYKGASFRVVPGHWPNFQSKEEVDRWIDNMEALCSDAFGKEE